MKKSVAPRSQLKPTAKINVPVPLGPQTQAILDLVNQDPEIFALWKVTSRIAQVRLHMTDHGFKHFQRITTIALKMLQLLHKKGIKMSIERDYRYDYDSAQTIVLLACLLHDIGMSVHREGHEEFSIILSHEWLDMLLSSMEVEKRVVLRSEILHAIISHRKKGTPLTLEAGIVRVADALDLTRSRVHRQHTSVLDIHSVSARAIDLVEILSGDEVPIRVNIVMNHTAGLFHVDELLRQELEGSRIEKYLDIKVYMQKGSKRQLFRQYLGNGSKSEQ